VARAERGRPARRAARWSIWWLAAPALGLAAWAAFAATLSLLGEGPSRTPSGVAGDAGARRPPPALVAAPVADTAPVPAAVPSPAGIADFAPAATGAPEPSATAPAQRAAADGARRVKPKRAPQEHLTEQDRRALDALVEQAGKNAR
jgi:hypothetical protein